METILKLNLIFFQIEINITSLMSELRFFLKFNILFLPIIIICYSATSYFVWRELSANAERDVVDKARVMLDTAKAMRTYTTIQISPLLDREQSRIEESRKSIEQIRDVRIPDAMKKATAQLPTARERQALRDAGRLIAEKALEERREQPEKEFCPQSVPFYAATEVFNYFRQQYPDYAYKEAALNPTNPRDRTSDWEMDIVEMFRDDASKKDFAGRRDTPTGPVFYVSTPVRVDDQSCLGCHGVAARAPPDLLRRYGLSNGFGWALNDVVGAQIVSIPARAAQDLAIAAQQAIMLWLAAVFAGLWLLVNGLVYVFYRGAFANDRGQALPSSAGGLARKPSAP